MRSRRTAVLAAPERALQSAMSPAPTRTGSAGAGSCARRTAAAMRTTPDRPADFDLRMPRLCLHRGGPEVGAFPSKRARLAARESPLTELLAVPPEQLVR